MNELPRVSVIVVNWNGQQHLERCFTALQRQTYPHVEMILVDNGSTDGSLKYMREHFPAVRIIANRTNQGFAAPNNQGFAAARGKYIATLNNDTEASAGWLAALVHELETHPQAGMAASLMCFADSPGTVNSAGIEINTLGIAWDRLSGRPVHEAQATGDIFGACAGAALYRKEMLERTGGFADHFFAYMEDVDLAWRAQLGGWTCRYTPDAHVLHVHSATSGEQSPFKLFLLGRNKVWLIARCYPSPEVWWWLPLIVLYDAAAVVYRLLRERDSSSLRGRLAGLRALPERIAERRQIHTAHSRAQAQRVRRLMVQPENLFAMYRRYRFLQRRAAHTRDQAVAIQQGQQPHTRT